MLLRLSLSYCCWVNVKFQATPTVEVREPVYTAHGQKTSFCVLCEIPVPFMVPFYHKGKEKRACCPRFRRHFPLLFQTKVSKVQDRPFVGVEMNFDLLYVRHCRFHITLAATPITGILRQWNRKLSPTCLPPTFP